MDGMRKKKRPMGTEAENSNKTVVWPYYQLMSFLHANFA
jgi:hypothetical protein